jgi:gamma-glutamyltranspeptidase/glutathione hydrolase
MKSLARILLFVAMVCVPVLAAPAMAVESPVSADSCMIVTAHPLATEVGLQVMRQGGNAVDAAVAAAFALAVCEPYSSGLGGGGFMVTYEAASGQARVLDAREIAPLSAHRDMYLSAGRPDPDLSRYGPLSVAVPGLVRGLGELHRQGGTLPWAELVEPARRLAAQGFPVSPMLQNRIMKARDSFNEAAREIFLPRGDLPQVGDLLVQADLASTLAAIASQGPEAFYGGEIAASIVNCATSAGAGVTLEDMAGYRPLWREPITGSYRGLKIISMPPPSSGGVHLVQMLNILEGFDLTATGFGSAATCHLLAEAMKFAFADRSLYLGDSDFVPVPVGRLTSRARADSLRALIHPEIARPESSIKGAALDPPESNETTHFSIVDGQGNAVAATLTINLTFGSRLVAPGTGVILNDEMDDFVAAPGRPNAYGLVGGEANSIAPGKRPLSSMTPTIILSDGRVRLVSGAPGGSRIITTVLQTIVNVLDFEMDALQAVSAPRIHHQWFPPRLYHEYFGLSPDTAEKLQSMGHQLSARDPMCNAQLIVVDPLSGKRFGASDPRGMGTAAGF